MMNYDYMFFSIIETDEGRKIKMRTKNNRDLDGVLETFPVPNFFVTVKKRQTGTNTPHFSESQSRMPVSSNGRIGQSFVHIMNSQNPYGYPTLEGGLFSKGMGCTICQYRILNNYYLH